ncbi:hypothetical protein [Planctomycetes bacterium CA13]
MIVRALVGVLRLLLSTEKTPADFGCWLNPSYGQAHFKTPEKHVSHLALSQLPLTKAMQDVYREHFRLCLGTAFGSTRPNDVTLGQALTYRQLRLTKRLRPLREGIS